MSKLADSTDAELEQPSDSYEQGLLDKYTPEIIEEMKEVGMTKPDDCPWGLWVGPKNLSHKHKFIANLAASGLRNKDIAEETNMTESRISIILDNPNMSLEITRIREKMFGSNNRRRLEMLMPKALNVAEDVLTNEQHLTKHKIDMAKYVLDQGLGKAKQDFTVSGNLLGDLLDKLDSQVKDVTQSDLDKSSNPIDNLAQELVPAMVVVGKRI